MKRTNSGPARRTSSFIVSRTNKTRDIVRAYSTAWREGDMAAARALLEKDVDFQGSIDCFQSADSLIAALRQFGAMLLRVEEIAELYEGQEAMLLYDCVTDTPAGRIRTAEYFQVQDKLIARVRVVFDATELRPIIESARQAGTRARKTAPLSDGSASIHEERTK